MNEGKIVSSYKESVLFLKKSGLLNKENYSRVFSLDFSKFSVDFISVFQDDEYKKTYQVAMEKRDYDLLLVDDSFFQFTYTRDTIRYAYYENPFNYKNYLEFLETECEFTAKEIKEIGEDYIQDYEQYISESELKKSVVPIRYDFDANINNYDEMVHTGSHIHLGHNNDIRIPTKMLLTPLGFCIFVMRNQYVDVYKKTLSDSRLRNQILGEKNRFKKCDSNLFNINDESQLYLF